MDRNQKIRAVVVLLVLFYFVAYEGIWKWMFSYVFVEPGNMLVLNAKIGWANPDPENLRVVEPGYKGVQREVLGEGRHFYNPFIYDRMTEYRSAEVGPLEIGTVESKSGKPLPAGDFLVDDMDHKGIWRRVLTPGKWRLNPVAYEVKIQKAVQIQPGFVGCVTALSGEYPPQGQLAKAGQRGVRAEILQAGIYYINPYEYKVTEIEVGYRELHLSDARFPSKDGFNINLDISVVWGLQPDQVPPLVLHFGSVEDVVAKIIRPQVESICRIEGSKYAAKDFIEGTTRERFQTTFTESLTRVLKEKNLSVVIGLVRTIVVPNEILDPIQQSKVAEEERLTKEQEQATQKIINELENLKADVEKGVREVAADTEKLVAEVQAAGEKQVAEIKAQQELEVALIDRKIAELIAERTRLVGKAEAEVVELKRRAEANKLEQNVAALGGAAAYANYEFATKLSSDFQVFIRYAGPGTFWTDMPGSGGMQGMADRLILERQAKERDGQK